MYMNYMDLLSGACTILAQPEPSSCLVLALAIALEHLFEALGGLLRAGTERNKLL